MATLGILTSGDRSTIAAAAPTKRHAQDLANRQPIAGARALAAAELGIALASLAGVLIATRPNALAQGLDNFLSMRVTLRNVILLTALEAAWSLIFRLCGLYTTGGVRSATGERVRVGIACASGSVLALALGEFTRGGGLRPRSVVYFWLATTAATLALRGVRRTLAKHRKRRRVLIVGTGLRALALWQRLLHDDSVDYQVAGFLDTAGSTPATDEIARQHLGTLEQLEPLLMRHAIDEVCITLPVKSHYHEIQEAILVCERVGVPTKYEANVFDSQLAWPWCDVPGSSIITMHVVPNDYRVLIKRACDVAVAAGALILLSPLMLGVAFLIKVTSRGPVIFAQERYGLNRRLFRMFKFRTMLAEAEDLQAELEGRNEADGPVFKISHDPRITRVGRILRRTSIDELPQLFNVLSGEMSLVGPRPLPLRDVTRFTRAADMRRFSVRPGLTCLWQISGRSTLTFADWIHLDLKYIDGWSLALDLLILVRTVPAVLRGIGAR